MTSLQEVDDGISWPSYRLDYLRFPYLSIDRRRQGRNIANIVPAMDRNKSKLLVFAGKKLNPNKDKHWLNRQRRTESMGGCAFPSVRLSAVYLYPQNGQHAPNTRREAPHSPESTNSRQTSGTTSPVAQMKIKSTHLSIAV